MVLKFCFEKYCFFTYRGNPHLEGMSGNEALVGEQLVRVQQDLNPELGAKYTPVCLVGNESPGIS